MYVSVYIMHKLFATVIQFKTLFCSYFYDRLCYGQLILRINKI